MEISRPPIYQCEEGHIICSSCKPLLTDCPHNCGKKYSEPAIRCRFAEKLSNKYAAQLAKNLGKKWRLFLLRHTAKGAVYWTFFWKKILGVWSFSRTKNAENINIFDFKNKKSFNQQNCAMSDNLINFWHQPLILQLNNNCLMTALRPPDYFPEKLPNDCMTSATQLPNDLVPDNCLRSALSGFCSQNFK